jgi:hypothetical protein
MNQREIALSSSTAMKERFMAVRGLGQTRIGAKLLFSRRLSQALDDSEIKWAFVGLPRGARFPLMRALGFQQSHASPNPGHRRFGPFQLNA